MAVLRIFNTITSGEEAAMNCLFGIDDNVCYGSVNDFIEGIADDDNRIDMRINCVGGSVSEGWAIYDALRATGKEISASVEGQCASMATIILLAAAKGNRTAKPHAKFCIHEPYIPEYTLAGAYRSEDLQRMADELRTESERFLDVYEERTGCGRDELKALMEEDEWISAEKAKSLGFIDEIELPKSARKGMKKIDNKSFKFNGMKLGGLIKALKKLSVAIDAKKVEMVAMELTTADGGTLTIDREEGEPQVGDGASPDGEHLMPDGRVIVVTEGVITEIREAEGEEELQEVVEELTERIEELEREILDLRGKAKTDGEAAALAALERAGGESALRKLQSTAKVAGRTAKAGSAAKMTQAPRFPMTMGDYRDYKKND